MTNETIPNVPRELLAELQEHIHCHHDAVLWGKVCDLLSATSPAGGGGLEVYITDCATCVDVAPAKTVTDARVVLAQDAQAIIDGLRGEVERLQFSLEVAKTDELSAAVYAETESIKHSLWNAEKECDQHAQRIGELEGMLLDARLMTFVVNSGHSGVLRGRIDAALSAAK